MTADKPMLRAHVLETTPPVAQAEMDNAIAAGDGTLHGAIDYWQGVAQRQAREIVKLRECLQAADEVVSRYSVQRMRLGLGMKSAQTYITLRSMIDVPPTANIEEDK